MNRRDRRVLLWLCCAAICWRWLVGLRAPLPGVDACRDLWLAEQLATGQFDALLQRIWEPFYGMLLAPALVAGAMPFVAAKATACLLGGLTLVPVALAAERLREGAGVAAAALAMVAAGPVVAAGAGAATSLLALLLACSLWSYASRRFVLSGMLLLVVIAGGTDQVAGWPVPRMVQLRLALGAVILMVPLLALRPHSRMFVAPALALLVVLIVAFAGDVVVELLPSYSPLLSVLAGVAVARVPVRLRDVLLALVVAADCHAAWTLGEPETAVVERVLPPFLARRVHGDGEVLLTTLPRVRWAAGQNPIEPIRPLRELCSELSGPRAPRHIGSLVMTATEAKDVSLRALLAASFEPAVVPVALQDLLHARGLTVLRRRH